ncbi:leucine-rich repeat extensin-like protein 5 [Motacilla alba alba]|uniref:leucine-rich repeat extensin-like protein 5 n=1 Tax=Motacilla alba alba TaxID=1094192 RepID=UPI0018D59A00|nr:leucine-rich repeat extensin-like protein 5 [Motacilla alba alba]
MLQSFPTPSSEPFSPALVLLFHKQTGFGLSQLPFGAPGQLPSSPDPPKETFASALLLLQNLPLPLQVHFQALPLSQALSSCSPTGPCSTHLPRAALGSWLAPGDPPPPEHLLTLGRALSPPNPPGGSSPWSTCRRTLTAALAPTRPHPSTPLAPPDLLHSSLPSLIPSLPGLLLISLSPSHCPWAPPYLCIIIPLFHVPVPSLPGLLVVSRSLPDLPGPIPSLHILTPSLPGLLLISLASFHCSLAPSHHSLGSSYLPVLIPFLLGTLLISLSPSHRSLFSSWSPHPFHITPCTHLPGLITPWALLTSCCPRVPLCTLAGACSPTSPFMFAARSQTQLGAAQ